MESKSLHNPTKNYTVYQKIFEVECIFSTTYVFKKNVSFWHGSVHNVVLGRISIGSKYLKTETLEASGLDRRAGFFNPQKINKPCRSSHKLSIG